MDIRSIENHLPGMQLISKLLDSMEQPALLLKIESKEITIESISRKFVNLKQLFPFNLKAGNLHDFYNGTETYAEIIDGVNKTAENKLKSTVIVEMRWEQSQTNSSFYLENTFLWSDHQAVYILQSLKPHITEKQEQVDLKNEQVELSLIYNHLSETVLLIAVEEEERFKFISVNQAFFYNTEFDAKEVVGRYVEDVIPPKYLRSVLAQYRQAVNTKQRVSVEETAEYPLGVKTLLITVTPYCNETGKCTKIICSILDITQRVNLEHDWMKTAEKMTRILDSSPDVICTINQAGRFKTVSTAALRIWGYDPDFLIGKQVIDFVEDADLSSTSKFLKNVMLGTRTTSFENGVIHKTGSVVPMIWSAKWHATEGLMYCTAREASEKKQAEQMLLQSEKRFRALVQDGSDMIAILDDTANYLYVSPSSKSVLDFEPEIFIGRNAFEFIHQDDIEKTNTEFTAAAGKRKFMLSPFRFMHNNGSWRWIQTVVTDLRDSPEIGGLVANSRDVTAIVQAQHALEISNERYKYVGKATSDAIWDWDIATGRIFWGEGFLKIFGYSDDMLNSDIDIWNSRIHPLDLQRVKQKIEAFLTSTEANWRDDYRFLKADGSYAHVVDKGFVIRDAKGDPLRMLGALQDITIRKKEEARLRVLESVVTNTIDAVLVAEIWPSGDLMTKIIFVNTAFEQMTGYQMDEVKGRSPWFLQGSGSDKFELSKLVDCIRNNRSYQGTIINYKKNGEQIWVNYSVTPVTDELGNYAHWIAILRDVSAQKQREYQQALLTDISVVFNSERGFKEAASTALSKIAEFGRFGFAALWMVDPVRGKLDLTSQYFIDELTKKNSGWALSVDSGKQYALQIMEDTSQASWNFVIDSEENNCVSCIKNLNGFALFNHNTLIGILLVGSLNGGNHKLNMLPDYLGKHFGTELHRKKLEQDLDQIFRLAPDIIAITDFSGNFKKLNPAAARILGYSMEELVSRPFSDFLNPKERDETISELANLRQTGKSYYIEEHYLTVEGRSKWLAWTSQPLEQEKLVYSVAKDITEKKELEELLLKSNSLARIGSWELTFPERMVSWSAITREILNAGMDFIPETEHPLGEFYPADAMMMMNEKIEDCISRGIPWDEVLKIKTVTGDLKWVRCIGNAELNGGKCFRLYGSLQDIDLQKRTQISAEEARAELEESERRYSELFHLSPLPMWVYDFESLNFLDVNQTAVNHYGYSKEEFLSMNIRDIRPVEDIQILESTLKKTRKHDNMVFQGTFKHVKKNGQIIQVDVKSNTIMYKGIKAKVIIASDITERLEYFLAIEQRNERLREIAWIQSHKVRAPLARLLGLVNMISNDAAGNLDHKKMLGYIEGSANELDEIIKEVVIKSEELDNIDT